ncbi:HNH endonuclease [Curtobacterium flaccumfaciens]|uniref:HNH endonuclease n=1 Tax=Curtobacterium flaccumfaciens TaxID=2035 RepID=UPI00112B97C8|nr:HNH endonuclease [Curtobacterium flaccumfaciens]
MSQNSSRGAAWDALKLRVWARDGYQCVYCGVALTNDHGPNSRTVDHVLAKANGGQDTIDNCLSACRSCNSSKGVNDIVRRSWVNTDWLDRIPA